MTTASVELKNPQEIGWMREAGRIVADSLHVLALSAHPGMKTAELDKIARGELQKRKARIVQRTGIGRIERRRTPFAKRRLSLGTGRTRRILPVAEAQRRMSVA